MATSTATLLDALGKHPLPAIDLGLERVVNLLKLINNPQDRLPPVVHIAGTNGKGSLVAFLEAMLAHAGYRTHAYTSPHLVRFHERIRLNGQPIDDPYLADILTRVMQAKGKLPLTFFESTTAAAFLAFSETPADILLLETGLGGRLDATNVVKRPALTVITPIAFDHMEFLGDTLAAIAGEKAGILKPGIPCVVGPQPPEALAAIEEKAAALGVPLYICGRDWHVTSNTMGSSPLEGERLRASGSDARSVGGNNSTPHGSLRSPAPPQGGSYIASGFNYRSQRWALDKLTPSLAGAHQHCNAATAMACVEQLHGFSLSEAALRAGIESAAWPARLQRLSSRLLPEGSRLWLDGGHNIAAAEALAAWCASENIHPHVIVGMMRRKDAAGFIAALAPYLASLSTAPIPGEDAYSPEALASEAGKLGITAHAMPSVEAALQALAAASPRDALICGSLYLAGQVLALPR